MISLVYLAILTQTHIQNLYLIANLVKSPGEFVVLADLFGLLEQIYQEQDLSSEYLYCVEGRN